MGRLIALVACNGWLLAPVFAGSILVVLHQEELLSGGPSLLAVKYFTCQGLVVASVQNETNCSDFRLRGCVLLICDADRTSAHTIARFHPTESMMQSIKYLGKVLACI